MSAHPERPVIISVGDHVEFQHCGKNYRGTITDIRRRRGLVKILYRKDDGVSAVVWRKLNEIRKVEA